MKTTLDLPDELMKTIKIRAVKENRALKDMMADLLARGLEAVPSQASTATGHRVKLPFIEGGHSAEPDEEMTPGRVAQILIEQDVEDDPER